MINIDKFTRIQVKDRNNKPMKGIVFPSPKQRNEVLHITKALINYDPLCKIEYL